MAFQNLKGVVVIYRVRIFYLLLIGKLLFLQNIWSFTVYYVFL